MWNILRVTCGLIVCVVTVIIMSKLPVFGEINERMQGLIAAVTGVGEVDHSSWLRGQYVEIGLELFEKSPFFGIGIDNARLTTRTLFGYDHYLHNNFVELLAGVGIIGFFCYYSMYFYIIRNMLKYMYTKDRELSICFVIIVILLAMDYGMVSYYAKETYFYLMIGFLMVKNLKRKYARNVIRLT